MFPMLFNLALVALTISTFSTTASTGRLSDFAHRKGFGPNFRIKNVEADKPHNKTRDNFRFYTAKTQPFVVDVLPDFPFDIGEMYAGLMPIDMNNTSRALYYVFQPTVGAPVNEITVWLNGGPGCSSLEGVFQENGRFVWGWGQYTPTINPYSWVNLTNVLWVEQPVGTGFSIGSVTANNEADIAKDFNNFFLNFQQTFGIQNFKIFLTGESYAGRYVSYISAAMLDRKDPVHFNVSGALMYDPVIGNYEWEQTLIPIVPFAVENNNVLGLNASFLTQLQKLDKTCGFADFRKKYLTFPPPGKQPLGGLTDLSCDVYDMVYTAAYATNPCFNVYGISGQCPLQSDPLGYPTGLQYSYPGQPIYFNRTDVKKAMHAPLDVEWLECKGPVFVSSGGPEDEGDSSPDPIQSVLPRVIEATNRVLIANGALDMSILTDGTLLAIQNMTWLGKLGFQSQPNTSIVITLPDLQYGPTFEANGSPGFEDPQGTMGKQHFERGLMWAETYLSGHMQPQFQPRSSYRHLQWLLGHIETL